MVQMNYGKECSNCQQRNPTHADYCHGCGFAFASILPASQNGWQRSQYQRSGTELQSTPQVSLRELENVAGELDKLWQDFYFIRQSGNENRLTWKLIFRHVAAHELNVKIQQTKERIEDIWLEAYVQTHQKAVQRLLGLLDQQVTHELEQIQLKHDQAIQSQKFAFEQNQKDEEHTRDLRRRKATVGFSENMKDLTMLGKLDRYAQSVDRLEQLFLKEGRLNGLAYEDKQAILYELVELVKAEIFSAIIEERNFAADVTELEKVLAQ